jgi:acetyl esterase/lipase
VTEVGDVEYLRHGETSLLASVYRPLGAGPFPTIVEIHGGAWCVADRFAGRRVNERLAQRGVEIVAIDFRMPPEAAYPGSLADINYAIRWVKANADRLGTRADLVGVMGNSSGGHQAALAALRPHDPRYAAHPLPAGAPPLDAEVRFAVLLAPVIDPLGRYHYAKNLKDDPAGEVFITLENGEAANLAEMVLPMHELFWVTEEAMAEGSPLRILERSEPVALPPILYIQGALDRAHPRPHLDGFVSAYRAAGGDVQLELFEEEGPNFYNERPDSRASEQAIEAIVDFVGRQTRKGSALS